MNRFGRWLTLLVVFCLGLGMARAEGNGLERLGSAPASTRLERMLLLLNPSSSRQQALTAKLQSLTTSGSADYHQWLNPSAFADAYAVSAAEAETVTSWLKNEGFTVEPLPAGRGWIEFSGSAATVEAAFGSQIEWVASNGNRRAALATTPNFPASVASLVSGLVSLDGTLSTAAITNHQTLSQTAAALEADSSAALTPKRMATLLAMHSTAPTGSGQTIALAARSRVAEADLAAFRAAFGLSSGSLRQLAAADDPGLTADDDQAAATLSAEWATALAPSAELLIAAAASTSATDGADLALAAIVDQQLAPTVVVGFSSCETSLSAAHRTFYATLYRQAAAEGMAIVAATGDSGPSACQTAGASSRASSGYGVNALAATPWNTAVGAVGSIGSESAAWSPVSSAEPAYAGGGGASSLYAAPSWQTKKIAAASAAMVASSAQSSALNSGHRLLPDLALPTAMDTANAGLAFYLSDSTGTPTLMAGGGSAAAAAMLAAVGAQLNQSYGEQGNLAPRLSALGATAGVYTDIANGNAELWCTSGSSGCESSGKIGYTAATGYDLASGWGSPNVSALVKAWPMATGTTAVTISLTPLTKNIGTNDPITFSLTIVGAGTDPVGGCSASASSCTTAATAELYDSSTSAALDTESLSSCTATSCTLSIALPAETFVAGTHKITVIYSGTTTYAPKTTGTLSTITVKDSVTVVLAASALTTTPGQSVTLTATVTPVDISTSESNPLGTVTFYYTTVTNSTPVQIGHSSLVANTSASGAADSSVATLNTVSLPGGVYTVYAVYAGDTYYQTATSNLLSLDIQDFELTMTGGDSPNLTVVKGASNSIGVTITGYGGYTQSLKLVCQTTKSDDLGCTVSPAIIALSSSTTTVPVTVTITTCTTGTTCPVTSGNNRSRPLELWPRVAGGSALALVGLCLLPFGRRARHWSRMRRLFVLLLLLTGLGGAGIGCNSSNLSSSSSAGTPVQEDQVRIVASPNIDNTEVSRYLYISVNVVKTSN